MGGIRCITRQTAAIALAAVLLLALAAASAAAVITGAAATLTLEPSSGEPGTEVVATAEGYGDCVPDVRVNALINRDVAGGVEFWWEEDPLGSGSVQSDGSASFTFKVSASSPGTYTVTARCVYDDALADSAEFTVIDPPKPIPVPDLKDMTLDLAKRALVLVGLVLGQVSGTEGTVQSQSPEPGTEVELRTPVDIVLGTAPKPVVVPKVVGLKVGPATDALEGVGLRLGRVSGTGDVVQSQDPAADTEVDSGSAVDVTVGPVPPVVVPPVVPVLVVVPRLIDLTPERAAVVLAKRGLVLGPVSGDGARIRKQSPVAGTKVRAGSAVSATTDRHVPPPPLIQVPNVVGLKVAAARTALTRLGLVLGGTPAADRTVASQQPAAGTLVQAKTVVTVTLAAPPMVRVPDLVGGSSAKARTALSAIGLLFDSTSDSDRDIVSQEPAAGTLVPVGTTVKATFAQPTPWPPLAGLTALLIGSGAVLCRAIRQQLDKKFVRTKVRAVVRDSAVTGPRITESGESPAMPVVRIEPHADPGTHVLEEV